MVPPHDTRLMPPGAELGPAQLEPVLARHLALGHREKARQASFGSQQIVVRVVEPAGRFVEADRE